MTNVPGSYNFSPYTGSSNAGAGGFGKTNTKSNSQSSASATSESTTLELTQANAYTSESSPSSSTASTTLLLNTIAQQWGALNPGLSPQETHLLLKALLGLPNDIQTLLSQLAFEDSVEVIQQWLTEEPHATLSLNSLKALLSSKSGDALGTLIRLLQQPSAIAVEAEPPQNLSALKDLLGALSQISQGSHPGQNGLDSLKNLLLLYLPWHPLAGQPQLELSFEFKDDDNDDDDEGTQEETVLTLYLQTRQLGRFRIQLITNGPLQLLFWVQHQAQAAPYLADMSAQLKHQFLEQHWPEPQLIFKPFAINPSDNADGQGSTATTPQMTVIPTENVPFMVVTAAYQLAKVILTMDQRLNS